MDVCKAHYARHHYTCRKRSINAKFKNRLYHAFSLLSVFINATVSGKTVYSIGLYKKIVKKYVFFPDKYVESMDLC